LKRSVKVLDAAAEEAAEAAAWYERQREGLGFEFQEAIEAALDLLEDEIVPLTPVPGIAGKRDAKRLIYPANASFSAFSLSDYGEVLR